MEEAAPGGVCGVGVGVAAFLVDRAFGSAGVGGLCVCWGCVDGAEDSGGFAEVGWVGQAVGGVVVVGFRLGNGPSIDSGGVGRCPPQHLQCLWRTLRGLKTAFAWNISNK